MVYIKWEWEKKTTGLPRLESWNASKHGGIGASPATPGLCWQSYFEWRNIFGIPAKAPVFSAYWGHTGFPWGERVSGQQWFISVDWCRWTSRTPHQLPRSSQPENKGQTLPGALLGTRLPFIFQWAYSHTGSCFWVRKNTSFIKMHPVSGSFSLCHPHKHTEKRLLTSSFELPIYFLPSSLSSLMLRLLCLPPCVFKATAAQPVNVGHSEACSGGWQTALNRAWAAFTGALQTSRSGLQSPSPPPPL